MPTEFRLVLQSRACGREVLLLRDDEAYAQKLADRWEGRTSRATGATGRVERREVSEWKPVPAKDVELDDAGDFPLERQR